MRPQLRAGGRLASRGCGGIGTAHPYTIAGQNPLEPLSRLPCERDEQHREDRAEDPTPPHGFPHSPFS
jgi:hypothetical protein